MEVAREEFDNLKNLFNEHAVNGLKNVERFKSEIKELQKSVLALTVNQELMAETIKYHEQRKNQHKWGSFNEL